MQELRAGELMQIPEHDKLSAVKSESQAIGEFLEWLQGEGVVLSTHHEHSKGCYCTNGWHETADPNRYSIDGCPECGGSPTSRRPLCGYLSYDGHNELAPVHRTIEQWLAKYFEIDLAKLETEKRAMLEQMRAAQGGAR